MRNIFILVLFVLSINSFAQVKLEYLSYSFPKDSLSGFNELGASNRALKGGYFGLEYKVYMYRAKRNYIDRKYGYFQYEVNAKKDYPIVNPTACLNDGFESSPVGPVSSVSGWTISEGSNTSSCSMSGCCPSVATGTNSWIRSTPLLTSTASIVIPNSPLGGSKVIQLGNDIVNQGEIVRLEQTFSVTPLNSTFQYAVFALMDGTGHACCDQPFLNVSFYDCSNILIPSNTFSFVAQGPSCAVTVSNWLNSTSGLSYHSGWQVFNYNLSAYIGSCVRVQVTVGDCSGWAHAGYCFFDAQCGASVSTGIENIGLSETGISLFPNPNEGEFEMRSQTEETITLINELGQTIRVVKLSKENNYSSKLSNLAPGIYFVMGRSYKRKVIVVK